MLPSLDAPAPTGFGTVASLLPGDPAPPDPPSAEAIPSKLDVPPGPPRDPDPQLTAPPRPGDPPRPTAIVNRSPLRAMTSLRVTAPLAPPAPPT